MDIQFSWTREMEAMLLANETPEVGNRFRRAVRNTSLGAILGFGLFDPEFATNVDVRNLDPVPAGLRFEIAPAQKVVAGEGDVTIAYRLINESKASIWICKWPGVALSSGYELSDGTFKGFMPGYPHTPSLGIVDFTELKTGETITGSVSLPVFPTPVGYLRAYANSRAASRQ